MVLFICKQMPINHRFPHNNRDASNELNQARLRVLKARDDVLQKLLVEAQQQLSAVGRSDQYPGILQKLIVQVCFSPHTIPSFAILICTRCSSIYIYIA